MAPSILKGQVCRSVAGAGGEPSRPDVRATRRVRVVVPPRWVWRSESGCWPRVAASSRLLSGSRLSMLSSKSISPASPGGARAGLAGDEARRLEVGVVIEDALAPAAACVPAATAAGCGRAHPAPCAVEPVRKAFAVEGMPATILSRAKPRDDVLQRQLEGVEIGMVADGTSCPSGP